VSETDIEHDRAYRTLEEAYGHGAKLHISRGKRLASGLVMLLAIALLGALSTVFGIGLALLAGWVFA